MSNIALRLINWQIKHGRHHLPWQNERDPYAIWLSEIMLQQTQVKTVIPYYQGFLQQYPTIRSLAAAPLEDIMALWSGLGYYSRAQYLHQAAILIMQDYRGTFPQEKELIQQLPGIGRSTAAAIAIFAFGERCAILDGNVKRVFTRYFGIAGYPGETKIQNLLWKKSYESLPANTNHSIETYTQALMDLGALICIRRKPQCTLCPLQQDCMAFRNNLVKKLPSPKPRKQLPNKETLFLILLHHKKILLEKRPLTGIWGGLWCPPETRITENVAHYCTKHYGLKTIIIEETPVLNHAFTHFKLQIHPRIIQVANSAFSSAHSMKWFSMNDALKAGIPSPARKLFEQLFNKSSSND